MTDSPSTLGERARADAELIAHQAVERERTGPANQGQRIMAHRVSRILGIDVDARTVRDEGYQRPYYRYSVDAAGLTFSGRMMSDTNGLRLIAAPIMATRRVKRLIGWREEVRSVERIGDLDGWL